MKLKHYTLKPYQLESKHLSQIHNIIEKVVSEKKDEYWDNYTDYSVFDQTMITIGLVDDKHKSIEERLDKIESAIEIILDKLLIDDRNFN